jgi:outer membrane immunogenic protein
MRRVFTALCLSAVFGFGVSSFASDPVAAAGYKWTGCYIGGNVGYGWQKATSTDTEPGTPPPLDAGTDTGTGVVGGGQVGCDYQFASNWVVGIQGMFDWAGVNGSHIVPFSYASTNTETFTTKTDWFGTLTARIGYTVMPQALLYFKGGAAWLKNNYSDADPSGTVYVPYLGQVSAIRTGWTIGGGGEYLLNPNWSVFVEYNYIDLGSKSLGFTYNCGAGCGFTNPYHYSEKQNLQMVLIGLNYRFDWGKDPVGTKN